MNRSVETRPDDRLIHYFCVLGLTDPLEVLDEGDEDVGGVGAIGLPSSPDGALAAALSPSDPEKPHPFRTAFECELVDQYPFIEYEDMTLPSDLSSLCFPRGGRLRRPVPPSEPMPNFWVSVMVDEVGRVSYLHCLILWERLTASQEASVDFTVGRERAKGGALFGPKCLCLVSRWNFPAFRDCLTELYRMSMSPLDVPLERVIGNLVTEVPLPPAGRQCVQYSIGSRSLTIQRPAPNHRTSADGLPMRQVFECLPLEAVEEVLRALITERPIVLHSSQVSLLSAAAEVFVALMYPLRWQGAYVPVLPCRRRALLLLDMMGFYILGMPTERWRDVVAHGGVGPDVVVVDLDRGLVNTGRPIPHLPSRARAKLLRSLQLCANVHAERPADWPVRVLSNADMAFQQAVRPIDMTPRPAPKRKVGWFGREEEVEVKGENWDAAREAFLRVFTALFRDYKRFLVYSGSGGFDSEGFLRSHYLTDAAPLLREVLQTQAWQQFVDERLASGMGNASGVDTRFFDESVELKRDRGLARRLSATRALTPFLDSTEYDVRRTIVALQPSAEDVPRGPFRYTPFPLLDARLFAEPRERRRHVAEGSTETELGLGIGDADEKWEAGGSRPHVGGALEESGARAGTSEADLSESAVLLDIWLISHIAAVTRLAIQALTTPEDDDEALAQDQEEAAVAMERMDSTGPQRQRSTTSDDDETSKFRYAAPLLALGPAAATSPDVIDPRATGERAEEAEVGESPVRLDLRRRRLESVASELWRVPVVLERFRMHGTVAQSRTARRYLELCLALGAAAPAASVAETLRRSGVAVDGTLLVALSRAATMQATHDAIAGAGSHVLPPHPMDDVEEAASRLRTLAETPDSIPSSSASRSSEVVDGRRTSIMERFTGGITGGITTVLRRPPSAPSGSSEAKSPAAAPVKLRNSLGVLPARFPSLDIDRSKVQCYTCNNHLDAAAVRHGWRRDANDFTTACPTCSAERLVPRVAVLADGESSVYTGSPEAMEASAEVERDGVASNRPVARAWKGDTGEHTPIWVEWLSPWALSRQMNVSLRGASPSFGPVPIACGGPAATAALNALCGRSSRGAITSGLSITADAFANLRKRSKVVFWNLVLHFQASELPLDHLLVAAGPPPALPRKQRRLRKVAPKDADAKARDRALRLITSPTALRQMRRDRDRDSSIASVVRRIDVSSPASRHKFFPSDAASSSTASIPTHTDDSKEDPKTPKSPKSLPQPPLENPLDDLSSPSSPTRPRERGHHVNTVTEEDSEVDPDRHPSTSSRFTNDSDDFATPRSS